MAYKSVLGTVVRGHGVASGQGGDPRFPGGTIQMQRAAFKTFGLGLDRYFPGTINVSIHPHRYVVRRAKHTLRQVKWADNAPPEDFSFFDCRLVFKCGEPVPGLIYYPHPETKPEHFQDSATLEVLSEYIDGLHYGAPLVLELDPAQLLVAHGEEEG